ncbi:hypothetical protein [Treponema pedis]|uniref:hypothetical protein n=1 Tax=Treponema pedis TaxID=409322 RepID=UPI0004180913|nr:hypothetical protein [Treponema pedis]
MKIKESVKAFVLFSAVFMLFSACKNQPIFYTIEQEVKLKDFSVKGIIVGFAEKNGNIYTANGEAVFYKDKNSTGTWTSIGSPGSPILTVAANGSNLFATGVDSGVKYYNGGSWTAVPGGEKITAVFGDSTMFGTDYTGSNDSPAIYEVNISGVSNIASGKLMGASGDYFATDKGLFKKNGGGSNIAGSPSNITAVAKGPGNSVFVLAGSTLHHYSNGGSGSWTSKEISAAGPSCIFYFEPGNTVLIGCKKGYTEIKLNGTSNLSGAVEIKPGEEGSTTPKTSLSQYESVTGSYSLNPIFVTGTKDNYSVFAGAAAGSLVRNTGLWAFYSFYKKEWNRE